MPGRNDRRSTGSLRKAQCLANLLSTCEVGMNTPRLSIHGKSLDFNIAATWAGRFKHVVGLADDLHHYLPGSRAYMQRIRSFHGGTSEMKLS